MTKHIFRFLGVPDCEPMWLIEREEHHHLQKVLRLPVGCQVEVMDGVGHWVEGVIDTIGKSQTTVSARHHFFEPPHKFQLKICLAGSKSKIIDETLPSIVELGADQIIVFQTCSGGAHTIEEKTYSRWLKIVKEALKQCKSPWLPQLTIYRSPQELVKSSFFSNIANNFFCDPASNASLLTTHFHCGDTIIVIGNEHGFDDETIDLLKSTGCMGVKLTEYILRAGTAAVAATTIAAMRRNSAESV